MEAFGAHRWPKDAEMEPNDSHPSHCSMVNGHKNCRQFGQIAVKVRKTQTNRKNNQKQCEKINPRYQKLDLGTAHYRTTLRLEPAADVLGDVFCVARPDKPSVKTPVTTTVKTCVKTM